MSEFFSILACALLSAILVYVILLTTKDVDGNNSEFFNKFSDGKKRRILAERLHLIQKFIGVTKTNKEVIALYTLQELENAMESLRKSALAKENADRLKLDAVVNKMMGETKL